MAAQTYFLKRNPDVPMPTLAPDVMYLAWNAEEYNSRFVYLDCRMERIPSHELRRIGDLDDLRLFIVNTDRYWTPVHPVDAGL